MQRTAEVLDFLYIVDGQVEVLQLFQSTHVLNATNEIVLQVEDLEALTPSIQMLYPVEANSGQAVR